MDVHGSDGDRHSRLEGDLDLIGRFLGNTLAVRKHALHHHVDDAIEILSAPRPPWRPRLTPLLFESRAVGMPARRISIEILVGVYHYFEVIGLHLLFLRIGSTPV